MKTFLCILLALTSVVARGQIVLTPSRMATLSGVAAGPSLPAGLQAWWRFDEGSGSVVGDSAGSYTGYTNNSPSWVSGKIGTAMQFSGTAYVNMGNVLQKDVNTAFSIAVWIKHSLSSGANLVSKQKGGDDYAGFGFGLNNSGAYQLFFYKGGTSAIIKDDQTARGDGAWHHAVLTYSGSGLASGILIYVDGGSVSTSVVVDSNGGSIASTTAFQLNGRGGANNLAACTLDDVRIYDHALTSDEVLTLYNATK